MMLFIFMAWSIMFIFVRWVLRFDPYSAIPIPFPTNKATVILVLVEITLPPDHK